ncbi:MAG: hypothetical protein A3H48_01795 [Candidatus Rokubacteria bacterium RIFCSPLOWO2_02_FULL_71_18]|nr:MAG: hypothetical protein A3H48_01795 [Candidatus Rokubacteria bacterium RIFCSPLOWO2_02_FULL_71_18]
MRVLGVDPGLVGTGYGLLEPGPAGAVVVTSGVIATEADLPLETRVHRIYDGVDRLLAEHPPSVMVLEDLYAEYKFPRTAILMAHARGVILLAARQRGVSVLALAPAEVKRAVTAYGAASKEQVQLAVRRLLRLETPPRPSHVADALALAITGFSRLGGKLP